MPGTLLEIKKPDCQPSGQPLVETCRGVDDGTEHKNWKTKKHMRLANTNVLPMEMLGSTEHNSNVDKCIADTYIFVC